MDFRPIAFLTGLLLSGLAIAMAPPAAADLLDGNPNWLVFVSAMGLTLCSSAISRRGSPRSVGVRSSSRSWQWRRQSGAIAAWHCRRFCWIPWCTVRRLP